MMNYYMMESPLTLTTSSSVASHLEDFADIDFNLLLSFDQEDQDDKDLLFFFDELEEKKEGCDVAFPFPTSMNMNMHMNMNMNEIIELDVFDEASLLSTSTDNEMSYQLTSIPLKVESNKKRCSKRKRNTVESAPSQDEMSSQCSSTISKKQKIINAAINTTAPLDYANKFIKTLNCGDMMEMQQSMQSMCSEKVKVTKHYYPTIEELRAQEEFNRVHPEVKQEEFLSTMQFQSMTDFLHYLKMINWIIPDGAFAIDNVRCCYEGGKTSVYMASFSYSGTSLCATMNLLSNKMSLLNYNDETIMDVLNQACVQKSFRRYKTEGSIALYVNEEGLINEIEFFETRSVFN
mmetsp:Transcript_11828/g.12739  ORF Transcript_11828/g.12739 Transcript_11828/m.12739 type:complete len:348 (-) Transcript_11828:480-1523(-)